VPWRTFVVSASAQSDSIRREEMTASTHRFGGDQREDQIMVNRKIDEQHDGTEGHAARFKP
jgi:hypothetical protein